MFSSIDVECAVEWYPLKSGEDAFFRSGKIPILEDGKQNL
jgi:hypothetical protein